MHSENSKTSISIVKRTAVVTLSALLLAQPISTVFNVLDSRVAAAATSTEATSTALVSQEPITSGATMKQYKFKSIRSGKAAYSYPKVIQVDLSNPYVKLDVMSGTGQQFTKNTTVSNMAKETGAVAAVNGDYYNVSGPGAPIGPQVTSGEILSSPTNLEGMYALAITKGNRPVIDMFAFQGKIFAQDGTTFKLSGVNKAPYYYGNPKVHSHANAIHMYTSEWASINRANDGGTKPVEVLVENEIVTQIADKVLQMTPPENGYILRASGTGAAYIKEHLQVGQKVSSVYSIQNADTNNPVDMTGVKTMIGGHTILVDSGKPSQFSRDVSSLGGYRSRTAVGYSQDGRYVYIVTADLKGESQGMSLGELQKFMVSIGVWKAMNLDGGGSTTLVSRPLGEFNTVLANKPENDSQRRVVNGLGVFTTAPQGAVKGIAVQGEKNLVLNEKAEYKLKAYDQYYNPVDVSSMPAQWSASSPVGSFAGNTFVAVKPGKATLTVTSGNAKETLEVNVIGRNQISQLKANIANPVLVAGASYQLPVSLTTTEGNTRTIPAESVKWELVGFEGRVQDGTLYVDQVKENTPGYAIARYDGYSTLVSFKSAEEKLWNDFESGNVEVSFTGAHPETTGTAAVVPGVSADNATNTLQLTYDYTLGTGTKAAYAILGGTAGYGVEGQPKAVKLDVMGDSSLNLLRAEFTDAKGTIHRVDLAKTVNWTGWKTITADLASYNMSYPIKLKKLYIANIEQGQDERASTGSISMDNIRFQYDSKGTAPSATTMKLKLGSKKVDVNGTAMTMDVAPKAIGGVTYIPIKFVTDALGGRTTYDPATKQVSILRNERLMELWFNDKSYVLNGVRGTGTASTQAIGGRTMIPLRLVSEKLGMKVLWEPKTQSITIE
ncbi:stalk domain-containing protein [Paenibacillus gansuensis]|uniref:Stalk domain-containing protein n=1 Tax=Paenibacillus gansuensis TaxID=306542 RepID=A0ABW5PLX5_9BACL